MLSFDVEEYFQVEAAAEAGVGHEQWKSFPKRLAPCVDRILQLLADHRASATFFVLGWVARHERIQIAEAGHEIASHGMSHRMIIHLTPAEFRRELLDSRRLLEDISGQSVIGYRAPTFSITHQTAWALDVLAESGFLYDSSIFPIHHDRYGVPDAPTCVHRAVGPAGGTILEIPPLTMRMMRINWPVGGGGYLRLLPVRVIGRASRAAKHYRRSSMLYLHPWELDPDQPILPMHRVARWRHRLGLGRTEGKLRWLLMRFDFSDVRQCINALTSTAQQRHVYGQRIEAFDGSCPQGALPPTAEYSQQEPYGSLGP